MAKKIKDTWDSIPKSAQRVASFISAMGIICTCVFGALAYAKNMITEEVHAEIEQAEGKLQEISMDTTRLQLLSLMAHDQDNVDSILIVAHKYFVEMGGDWYMTERFKEWATEHNISLQDFTFAHE